MACYKNEGEVKLKKSLNLFLIFALLFLSGKTLNAQSMERVRVHVFSRDNLQTAKIFSATTSTILLKATGDQIQVQEETTSKTVSELLLEASPSNPISVITEEEGTRKYSGRIKIRAHQSRLHFVEELPLEAYVRGVLASEMPQDFPLEALKAQAVLARTYAIANKNRHQEEGFQFCDLTHCQAYGGWAGPNEKLDAAVRGTRSLILSYHGEPAEALYHSTCGGHTSPNQKVFWGKPLPYLQGVSDGNYCSASPHSNWESSLALPSLSKIISSQNSFSGEIKNLQEGDHEVNGRVFSIILTGNQSKTIDTEKFLSLIGQSLGWNQIKSNWFNVEVKNDEANFKGHGLGHGVGLCQWGAKGMAEDGKKFNEILAHYFPGTQLTRRGQ
jgi:stage II sporulation protein D